jgi:hypothetical protein
MNADVRKFAAKLLCDRKAWKAVKKPKRPLKDKSTQELKADGVHEAVRQERNLKTRGQALALVGAELRHRVRETG